MCRGACCELSPVPTRPHNNVLLAPRGSLEQGKLSGPLCRSWAVPGSVGFLGEVVQVSGWAVAVS